MNTTTITSAQQSYDAKVSDESPIRTICIQCGSVFFDDFESNCPQCHEDPLDRRLYSGDVHFNLTRAERHPVHPLFFCLPFESLDEAMAIATNFDNGVSDAEIETLDWYEENFMFQLGLRPIEPVDYTGEEEL